MRNISKTTLTFFIFGFAFLYIPLFFVIANSFSASEIPGIWTTFSLKWFYAVFDNHDILHASLVSFKIASISATASVVLGLLAAISTTKSKNFVGKTLFKKIISIPAIMPEIIVGFSLLMLFVYMDRVFGWPKERGLMTVVIGHTMSTMAYVHITIRAKLLTFDVSLEEAAMDLGAKQLTVFLKIKIPIIFQSIVSCWLLSFTLSLDDLVIASFLSGPGSTTIPMLIFSNIKTGVSPMINAFATMFILIVGLSLCVSMLLTRKKIKK